MPRKNKVFGGGPQKVTVDLKAGAVNDILTNSVEGAHWSSIRDLVASFKRQRAPVVVPTAAVKGFTITTYEALTNDQRAFFVNNFTSIGDLAKAIEQVLEIKLTELNLRIQGKGGPLLTLKPMVQSHAAFTMQAVSPGIPPSSLMCG